MDGVVAAIVASRRHLFLVLNFTITRGKIIEINVDADPHVCASCTLQSSTTDEPPPIFRAYLFDGQARTLSINRGTTGRMLFDAIA